MRSNQEAEHEKLVDFWAKVTQLVLERSDRFGPLIQSLRAAVPITWDGDTLVLGVSGTHGYLAGHLGTATNRHRVIEALKEVANRDVDYRLIEGTTLEDWEVVKKKAEISRQRVESAVPQPVQAPPTPVQAEEGFPAEPWANLQQNLHFAWQRLGARRTMPVARAEFLREALEMVLGAEAESAAAGESEESMQRLVTRAVERIAGMVEFPATGVALELVRLRSEFAGPGRSRLKPAPRPKKKSK